MFDIASYIDTQNKDKRFRVLGSKGLDSGELL